MAVFGPFSLIGCSFLCTSVHTSVWHLAWYELRNVWNDIFPAIGDLPIRLVLSPKLLKC
ncbi:hypothetical protein SAMN05428984_3340 [Sphingomonas sp. OK281]|nr:hypothetical protein SAMN05428984_3340 [Sphingomonas sp. OK281]